MSLLAVSGVSASPDALAPLPLRNGLNAAHVAEHLCSSGNHHMIECIQGSQQLRLDRRIGSFRNAPGQIQR